MRTYRIFNRWSPAPAGLHFVLVLIAFASVHAAGPVRELSWDDIASPLQQLLTSHGIHGGNLRDRLAGLRQRNRVRVAEGDRDHLVYYVLQSSEFTKLPPIEPAVSAKTFASSGQVPAAVTARITAFHNHEGTKTNHEDTKTRSDHEDTKTRRTRLAIFSEMFVREKIDLEKEYVRAMKFASPVGALYQERGLSTDTTIDAGYAVYLSLAALRRLEPVRQFRSALVIGPGFDLAPRTGLLEHSVPQSYQPFAVMDALISSGLSTRDGIRVTAADINPRVTGWVIGARGSGLTLTLISGVREQGRVRLSQDYREYFVALGQAIGAESTLRGIEAGRLGKSIAVAGSVTEALDATTLDITVERLDMRFDLIVVTNVFPYLSDAELLLAVANISNMLSPGGVLIHNEPRPALADALHALAMPMLQSRSGVVATVEGGTPLYDTTWMHGAPSAAK